MKFLNRVIVAAALAALICLAGCSRSSRLAMDKVPADSNPFGGSPPGEAFFEESAPARAGGFGGGFAGGQQAGVPVMNAKYQPPPPPAQHSAEIVRKIVYTGSIGLRVPSSRATADEIEALVERRGGFIQNSSLDEIVFRLSPDQFKPAMAELETMGEVFQRSVNSRDITADYLDVEIRIETALKSRERLLELLGSAKEIEDIIQIERDLRRLTEEIETLKGRLRVLADQVDLATITVMLRDKSDDQSDPPPRREESPFPWIRQTGIAETLEPAPTNGPFLYKHWWPFAKAEFDLGVPGKVPCPEGFVPLRHRWKLLLAATPEDFRLRVRTVETAQEARPEFWAEALLADLRDGRGYMIQESGPFPVDDPELAAQHVVAEVVYAGETWLYDLWIVQEDEGGEPDDDLAVIEYARLASSDDDARRAAVETAVRGVKLRM